MAAAATSTSAEHKSTAPSPTSRRPRRKHQDPFVMFANTSISEHASAEDLSKTSIAERSHQGDQERDAASEPLLSRLVMMPLLSISFILALFIVERSERVRRSSEHPSQVAASNKSLWSPLSLQNWLGPEPYQDPDDKTWQNGSDSRESTPPQPKRNQWFLQKKHRKVSKMQITEAFEMRSAVAVVLLALTAIVLMSFAWICSKAYRGLTGRLF